MIAVSITVIFIVSFLLAIIESRRELSVPKEVEKIRINKKEGMHGVIIFLKEKIIHYSSHPSS